MANDEFSAEHYRRFPGLAKLGFSARRRIPFVQQTTLTDCGPASLAMVLGYFGKEVTLREVRDQLGLSRDGTNAFAILQAGRSFGLRGRGIKVPNIADMQYLPTGAILHWRFKHFVVLERLTRDGVIVQDPAEGRRLIEFDELDKDFTGVALVFEPGESFEEQRAADLRRPLLRRYLDRIVRAGLLSRIVITSLLVQLLALAPPLLVAVITDRVIPREDIELFQVVALGMAVMAGFHFLSSLVRAHLLLHLRTKLDAELTLDFLEHLVKLPFAFFQHRSAGDLMMRMNTNSTVREILTSNVLSGVLDGAMVTLYLLLIFAFDATMGLLVLGLALLRIMLYVATFRRNRRLMSQSLQAEADSQGYQVQMLSGMETLKASGSEHRAVEHWSNLYAKVLNVSLAQGRLDAWVNSTLDALRVASPLAVLLYGASQVMAGELTLGTMLAINSMATGFLQPLSTLINNLFQLQRLGSYLDRLEDVFDTPLEQDPDLVAQPLALRGGVELEGVSFRYDPDAPLVVKDVSVDIPPRSFVAIAGASGSGKSTLAKLIAGLYEPEQGDVRFDGSSLRSLDLHKVRQQIGVVPQHPHLFSGSVRSNIALVDAGLPLHRVVEAARRAQIHDEIIAMPMGYETVLSDQGSSLSGGQRQRVALARALIARPKLLLLDEATSALDAVTESRVLGELEHMNITRVLIAHRLSTVRNADMILVMRDGQVVERGTYSQLLAMGGYFAELVAGQRERTPPVAVGGEQG